MVFLVVLPVLRAAGTEGDGNSVIKGTITTSDAAPAAAVTVQLKNSAKSAISDADGHFQLKGLSAGTYEVHISLTGYREVNEQVTLKDNETVNIDIRLELTHKELEEVIVNTGGNTSYKAAAASPSLRLQTPVLETPQNIQVVTAKALTDQQITTMSDGVLRNVSGTIRLEHWGDLYTNVNARGSQVQAFRNGFNMVASYWGPLTEDMSYVDHIEFVKGPAGFMLSNGDPSGLYNVVTKKPTGINKGEASFTLGSFDLYRATLDLDGKLSRNGKLLYRLNTSAQQKGSFRANEFNDRYALAPVISYQLDDHTKLTAEYNWQNARMSDVGSYYAWSTKGYASLPVNFSSLPAGLPPTVINDHSVFLNLQHELSKDWKLTAQTLYSNYRQTGSSMWPGAVNADGTMLRATSSWDAKSVMTMAQAFLNGTVQTGSIRHRILGGIDLASKKYYADWGQYFQMDSVGALFNTLNPNLGTPVNGYPKFDFSTPIEERATAGGGTINQRYTSVYVQDELGFLNNQLRITLAGRYTNVNQANYGGTPATAKRITPRAGISYSIDRQTAVYGLYDQAFTPQTGLLRFGGEVKPITGNNIEFGLKRDWAGGKWNTTLSVYRIIKNNELTADPNNTPAQSYSIVLGQKRAQGIEFDVKGRIIDGLNIIANYALTDSKLTKVADNIRYSDGTTLMKVGDPVPAYAKHVANAWLTYRLQSGVLKGLGIQGGMSFMSGRHTFWDLSPDPAVKLPNYTKFDAGVSYEKDAILLSVNVFNIANKYLYSGSYYQWLKAYYWQADPPRNFRFSINYRF